MISLYRSRSRAAFIDDDAEFLDALTFTIPRELSATYHQRPDSLDAVLSTSQIAAQAEQAALGHIAEVQSAGNVDVLPLVLEFFADPGRFDITGVLVADYNMPAENGVSVCERHGAAGLQRILLTGFADHDQAIQAFNRRAIEMYIPKHDPVMPTTLKEALQGQILESCGVRGSVLRQALSQSFSRLVASAPVAVKLRDFIAKQGVVEYMILGAPQGVLGLRADRSLVWIQIEDDESLVGLVEALREQDWAEGVIGRVERKVEIVNLDVAIQFGQVPRAQPATVLSVVPYMAVSVFTLDGVSDDQRPADYGQWLQSLEESSGY